MSIKDLVKDIKEILQESTQDTKEGLNKLATLSSWEIGHRIVEEEQQGKKRAGYGQHLLESLSEELTQQYGRGYSANSLQRMRKFSILYRKKEIEHQLNWSMYRVLIGVGDSKKRKQLQHDAIRLKLSRDQLHERAKKIKTGIPDNDEERYALLKRPAGELWIYKTRAVKVGTRTEYNLDLGFKVWLSKDQAGLIRPVDKQLMQSHKTGKGFKLETYRGQKTNCYLYKANLDHVIDGDTLVANIDAGFGIQIQQIIRMRHVNAPELRQQSGQAARDYLKRKIKGSKCLLIKTRSRDKFDRYVSDIFLWDGRTSTEKTLKEGDYLNQIMLDSGHGVYAPGG